MLAVIVIWLYVSCLTFVYGVFAIALLQKMFGLKEQAPVSFCLVALTGLGALTILSSYLAIFINLGVTANILVSLCAIGGVILARRKMGRALAEYIQAIREADKRLVGLFALAAFAILMQSTSSARVYDAATYAQVIKWIEAYGQVPGLANLNPRFGFNSSWLLPNALFSFSFVRAEPFHVLNGWFALLSVGYALRAIRTFACGAPTPSSIIGLALLGIGIPLYWHAISSPDVNTPVTFALWLLFVLATDTFSERLEFGIAHLLIFVLACYVLTFRLSAAPMLLLAAYILFLAARKRTANGAILLALAVIIVAPWIIRNIVQSGYLIYPYPSIDWFNVDWKVPAESVLVEKQWIESWARVPGLPYDQVLTMTLSDWLPLWWQSRPFYDKLLIAWLGLFGCIGSVRLIANIQNLSQGYTQNSKYLMPFLAALGGTLFVFLTAPDLRFGHGFMIVLGIFWAVPLFDKIFSIWRTRTFSLLLGGVTLEWLLLCGIIDYPALTQHLIFPAAYPRPEAVIVNVGNFQVNVPKIGDQCWMTPLPCTPYPNPKLQMRGSTFADGFRMNEP